MAALSYLRPHPHAHEKDGSSMSELVVQNTELTSSTLFGTDNPAEVVERAATVAKTLADLVRRQNLIVRIGQSEHVRVEGWTLLGSMLGVFPVVTWTRPVMRDEEQVGWEARVEARTRGGEVVGAAEAECLSDERTWKGRDDYARRSMAQTRAVSKALRLPLGFVMQLAGFDPTPAEEMPVIEGRNVSAGGNTVESRTTVPAEPSVDMLDPDIPFGDAAFAEHQPQGKPATPAQKKKLNVLIGKLRPAKVTTLELWKMVGREPAASEDGELHWSPLRDALTSAEAHELIDRLERISTSPDDINALTARLVGASKRPQEAAYMIAMKAQEQTPAEHLAWLQEQERKHFAGARGGDA
jgi:uncharacterized protein YciI